MQKIHSCLWFNDEAGEAANYYTSLFENSKIFKTSYYGKSGSEISGRKDGSVMAVNFQIGDYRVDALNGGNYFKLNPAISMFVKCKTEKEIDHLWAKLSQGNRTLFELQEYPWSKKYGWCTDQFGLSWQMMIDDGPNKIAPVILFSGAQFGKAEEAINFYVAQFKNSKIEALHKNPADNSVMHARFVLDGAPFILMEGPGAPNKPGQSAMKLDEAFSFIIDCETQDEVDHFWTAMVAGGGKHSRCGWLQDRFGVCWQVIPRALGQFLSDANPKKVEAVMSVMLKMQKLNIEELQNAYRDAK